MSVETIYLIHHSHTDVGYTHDQPVLWDLYQRFIDEALDLAERSADRDSDGAFRWTIENTAPLLRWLEHASDADVERLIRLEKAGRVEVTGMFANLTPLFDGSQLVESLQPIRHLREDYGFDIRHAMNCDVNGENWPLVDLLLDAGIEAFTMAINIHFGGAPAPRPEAFHWQGPSGRSLLSWNGWAYSTGWMYGIGRDAEELEHNWWPRIERHLEAIHYPLPVLMIQSYHPFGDNGSALAAFSSFIDTWNKQGKHPRIVMATPRMWWAAVAEHQHTLATHHGDWTDYWNFGAISSARETSMNRASRVRLRTADAVAAGLVDEPQAGMWAARSMARYRDSAWQSLNLWDEHTWGADMALRLPDSEDVASQWYHKAHYAYQARSLSLLLQRDALADLSRRVAREDAQDILVFNPLPWERHVSGEVPQGVLHPRGVPEDSTAGRHYQDRFVGVQQHLIALGEEGALQGSALMDNLELRALPATRVPSYGYSVVKRDALIDLRAETRVSDDAVVENDRYRLRFDKEKGGISSWYDKALGHEWCDEHAGYPLHTYVHERVADTQHDWPRELMFKMDWHSEQIDPPRGWKPDWPAERSQASAVLQHQVITNPLGVRVLQRLAAPGCAGDLLQSVFMPSSADYIECESWWEMNTDDHPQASYVLFPLNIPQATVRMDVGAQAMQPEQDQLAGSCRDYFTVQQWLDFNNGQLGMTIAVPENPMVQLGDFHFAHNQQVFTLERALLLGWVTNNYWETNFRAAQPGRVHARYRLQPYQGAFHENKAHRFGVEAAHAEPLMQHLGEPPLSPQYPQQASLLHFTNHNDAVVNLHIKAARHRSGIILRLFNSSDDVQAVSITSGLLQVLTAQQCDVFENPTKELAVHDGAVQLDMQPRRLSTIHLGVSILAE